MKFNKYQAIKLCKLMFYEKDINLFMDFFEVGRPIYESVDYSDTYCKKIAEFLRAIANGLENE